MNQAVTVIIESLGGGGAQQVASHLMNAWAMRNIAVTVISLRGSECDAWPVDRRVERVVIGGAHNSSNVLTAIFANLRRIRRLRAALRDRSKGTVISFGSSINVLTVLASWGLGRHVVICERSDPARQNIGAAWEMLRRALYRRASLVTANSFSAIRTLSAYVPNERLLWLPNPLRTKTGYDEVADVPTAPFFLAVGRLEPVKGHDDLITAFAVIAKALPEWLVVILGEGSQRATLERKAAELGIRDRLCMPGWVEDPFPWYRSAAVIVHPSLYEGMSNVVLEAMNEGRPVILTLSQTGMSDFVQDGINAATVPDRNPDVLAETMLRLATDLQLRDRLGDAARKAVEPFRHERAMAAWNEALRLVDAA